VDKLLLELKESLLIWKQMRLTLKFVICLFNL